MAVTIKDLARRLNVSTSVVSTVLNGKKYCGVSDELRKKVLALAEELKCCPNANARALRCGRSDLVGVMMPSPIIRFYSQVVAYLQQKLQERGKAALFYFWNTNFSREEQHAAYNRLISYGVDGVILWDEFGYVDPGTPTVIYHEEGDPIPEWGDRVLVKTFDAMKEAVEKLDPPEGILGGIFAEDDKKAQYLKQCGKECMLFSCQGGKQNAGQEILRQLHECGRDIRTLFFGNVENLVSFSLELFRNAPDELGKYSLVNVEGFPETIPCWLNVFSFQNHWQMLADGLIDVLFERIKNPALPQQVKNIPLQLDF